MSAKLYTIGYGGFNHSTGSGAPGWLLWSGSFNFTGSGGTDETTDYTGLGIELSADADNFLRFTTDPSLFEIRTKKFFVGSTTTQFISGSDGNIEISSSNFHLDNTGNVIMQGTITAEAGNIGGFAISDDSISSSNDSLILMSDGRITGSDVLFNGGEIAGWTINTTFINKTDANGGVKIDAGNRRLTFRTGSHFDTEIVKIGDLGSNKYGILGLDSADSTKTLFKLGEDGNEIAGWGITSTYLANVNSDGGVKLDAGSKRLTFRTGSHQDTEIVFVGDIGTNQFGIKALDADDSTKTLFKLGEDGNEIAGWTITEDKLQGGAMIIRQDGTVESDGFASNLPGSGFRLTAASGGFLEVENARIRGTLSTATFEKESVNAVGGQLYVANSTTLTGSTFPTQLQPSGYTSSQYPETETTLSVVNVSGFSDGEILSAKKINNTGFSTEYMKVESSSRFGSDDNDLTGALYVVRGFQGGTTGETGSLGDLASVAVPYSGSQVLVSTGKVGSGYIRLNANPNDLTTPYIDIVERTGSDLYDIQLKARLGDLSGITDSRFSDDVSGFGLYTENGYFSGKIEVASLPQAPAADKLLAYYPLDTVNAIDASGRNTGAVTSASAPTVVAHPAGFGLQATDAHQLVLRATDTDFQTALAQSSWTMCFYLTANAQSSNYEDIIHWNLDTTNDDGGGTTATNKLARFEHTSDNDSTPGYTFLYHTENAAGDTQLYPGLSFPNLNEGQTYHIAIVSDIENNSLRGYIDGVSSSADDFTSGGITITSTAAGTSGLGGPELFASNVAPEVVSELRFYTGSLSAAEIEAIYLGNTQQGGGRTVIEGGQIKTGKILSNNWSDGEGSEINLNAGRIRLGGILDPKFEVSETGAITSSAGKIANFEIDEGKLNVPDNFHISTSTDTEDAVGFISSSGFKVSADGRVTGSNFLLSGGRITGDVTIEGSIGITSGDLASQSLSSSAFHEDFNDVTQITTDNYMLSQYNVMSQVTSTPDGNPVQGIKIQGTSNNSWRKGLIRKTDFSRGGSPKLVVDLVVNEQNPATFIGWVTASMTQADLETADNWKHAEALVYLQSRDVRLYVGGDGSNAAQSGSNVFGSNIWPDDVDANFRVELEALPEGEYRASVYQDTDFTAPLATVTTAGSDGSDMKGAVLRPAIFMYYSQANSSNFAILTQMGVNKPLSKTTITGDGIKTGRLTSTNLTSTTGAELNLNTGKLALGGSVSGNSAKLEFQNDRMIIRSGSTNDVMFDSDDGKYDGSNNGRIIGFLGLNQNIDAIYNTGGGSPPGFQVLTDDLTGNQMNSGIFQMNKTDEYLAFVYSAGVYVQGSGESPVMLKFILDILDTDFSDTIPGSTPLALGTGQIRRTFTIVESIGRHNVNSPYGGPPPFTNDSHRGHYPGLLLLKHNVCDDDQDATPLSDRTITCRMQYASPGNNMNHHLAWRGCAIYTCNEAQKDHLIDAIGTGVKTFYTNSAVQTRYHDGYDWTVAGCGGGSGK